MDSSAETIKLKINYQKKDYEIELPLTATVYQLKEAVYKATNVPVALQKLLRSGLQLKDDNASLQAAKITNNAKIMLVATDLQSVIQINAPPATSSTNEPAAEEKHTSWSEETQHKKIIEKGPPDDAIKPLKGRNDPILGSISGLLNNRGTKVRLSFKNDTQELVVATSSSTTKIPYSSITKVEDQEIVGHEGHGQQFVDEMDINLFRVDKGDINLVKESQRRRFQSVELVDEITKLDEEWRKLRFNVDEMNKAINKVSKQVAELKKAAKTGQDGKDPAQLNQEVEALIKKSVELQEELKKMKEAEAAKKQEVEAKLSLVGNIVHQSVPVSQDEADNRVERTWGELRPNDNLKHHHELLWMIGGYEPEKGSRVAGHRGYYLTGMGVALNQALIQYGLQFLMKRQYTLVQTPLFMKKEVMAKVAQLSEFDEALYKVTGAEDDEEMYLIATSEQPLCGFHLDDWIDPKQLPLRYAGISTCFRKEAGKHGKDTWGIFRTHQFEKVEQFVVTAPDKSWEMHEEMIQTAEEFYQSLGIPYRVVTIVSGELNNAAAKKYDLEGWFPAFQEYRELVSASNCTDYQARRMEARYGTKKAGAETKQYVHMLNATLTATGRTICAILENFQTPEGIKVPKPLQPFLAPYTDNPEFIPFIRAPPKPGKGKAKEK